MKKPAAQNGLLPRRQFVTGISATALLSSTGLSLSGRANANAGAPATLQGNNFDLDIGYVPVNFTGQSRLATGINGGVPGPILRWREGETVKLRVRNNLHHDSSIHWHGMILPTEMDGVPGLSFDGIRPGEHFDYEFPLQQSGTYWYHSHSGFQEQSGVYGAIVIDPKEPTPAPANRDFVIVLSDWSDEAPEDIYATLKKMSHYYNFRERTAGDLWRDIREKGLAATWRQRGMWNNMRMSDTDVSDVTGYTYTYLMNGQTPDAGWLGLFKPGEKIRLRFVNAAAMTLFDVRIPGLKMTVLAADGQDVEPVSVDEFRIGVAETYDVLVEPAADAAYCVFAQAIDRSGYTRGTLTSHPSLRADVPKLDAPPLLSHRDMGMNHNMAGGMDHSQHKMQGGMDHSQHKMRDGMDHSQHKMQGGMMVTRDTALGPAGLGSDKPPTHRRSEIGVHVDMRAEAPQSGLEDPGIGLRQHREKYGRKVLTYADLANRYETLDKREPSREIELHLTGNMSRYMWSINGIKFADADPIQLTQGERVRFVLINDTMMTHPVHLHGLWSELETGEPDYIPRKHTIIVQPGSRISYLVTADAIGRWAYHCHLLYHMPGMMREVRVSGRTGA